MLDPYERSLLLQALRPPTGCALGCALGTTYSMDLLAMLTVPLAFTFFEWEERDGRPTRDLLALREAVHRNAGSIRLFCQAGGIAVPPRAQRSLLYVYLEKSVIQVQPPSTEGVFHPKVWVLRFMPLGDAECRVRYRFLCLTRNLTFDRSWDTVLGLEGDVGDAEVSVSAPLADFVQALPRLAVQPADAATEEMVRQVQGELRRVDFRPPEGFDALAFHPLGHDGRARWPFPPRPERALVVSPFLEEHTLERLAPPEGAHVLISRAEALGTVTPGVLEGLGGVFVVDETATGDAATTGDTPDAGGESAEPEAGDSRPASDGAVLPLTGLHAKLYVMEEGPVARMWSGSANATHRAFDGNVEFLVELSGKKGTCGIGALLQPADRKEAPRLGDLLRPYTPPDTPASRDETAARLHGLLEHARRSLVRACLRAQVKKLPDGAEYRVLLRTPDGAALDIGADIGAECWAVTRHPDTAVPLKPGSGVVADLGRHSLEALTAFYAFRLTAAEGEHTQTLPFVLSLPLDGTPQDREDRVLARLLTNPQGVIRFLLLLLSDIDAGSFEATGSPLPVIWGASASLAAGPGTHLFERLLRALHRSPERLDEIAATVDSLQRDDEGRKLLPEGFMAVWEPIWTARKEQRR